MSVSKLRSPAFTFLKLFFELGMCLHRRIGSTDDAGNVAEGNMEQSQIEERVRKVISEVLKIDEMEVKAEANFIFDLGADSMQSVQLVAALEEEFDIEMDEEEAFSVQTVSKAVDFIQNILEQKGS